MRHTLSEAEKAECAVMADAAAQAFGFPDAASMRLRRPIFSET